MSAVQVLLVEEVYVVACLDQNAPLFDIEAGELDDFGLEHDGFVRVVEAFFHLAGNDLLGLNHFSCVSCYLINLK